MRTFVIISAMTLMPPLCAAQQIDVKGIKLGMSRSEVTNLLAGQGPFTLGGVGWKSWSLDDPVRYDDEGKVEHFYFTFRPEDFPLIKTALLSKYPKTACKASAVKSGLGTEHLQETCTLRLGNEVLEAVKFDGDITTGSVFVYDSKKAESKARAKASKAKKDI